MLDRRERRPQTVTVGSRSTDAALLVYPEAVTRLDGDELDALLAHELAHLASRDSAVLTLLSLPAFDIVLPESDGSVRSNDLWRLRLCYRRRSHRPFGTYPGTAARIQRLRRLG